MPYKSGGMGRTTRTKRAAQTKKRAASPMGRGRTGRTGPAAYPSSTGTGSSRRKKPRPLLD
jgi:hypothetical protein